MVDEEKVQLLSGADSLVAWAQSQDGWINLILDEVLSSRAALPDSSLQRFYDQFLIEKGLLEGDVQQPNSPRLAAQDKGLNDDEFVLTALEGVKDVNQLAADQRIVFHKRFTLLYGENGVGKTGYSRILKRAAAVRTVEDILPDVYENGEKANPEASISYRLGSTEATTTWKNELGLYPFTRLGVFDPRSVQFHVDDALTFFYTPRDLVLFKHTHEGIERIKSKLDEELQTS